MKTGPKPKPILGRLMGLCVAEPNSGCWLWTGALYKNGYAAFGIQYRIGWRARLAHRISYELHVGQIPSDRIIDHKCKTRSCVNPHHLEPVTHLENSRRGRRSGRKRLTHCMRGHEFSETNIVLVRRPDRVIRRCRACLLAQGQYG